MARGHNQVTLLTFPGEEEGAGSTESSPGYLVLWEHQAATRIVLNSSCFVVRWALMTCALLESDLLELEACSQSWKDVLCEAPRRVGECFLFPPLPAFSFFSGRRETQQKLEEMAGWWGGPESWNWPVEASKGMGGMRLLTSFLLVHSAFARNKMPFSDMGQRKGAKWGRLPDFQLRAGHGMGQLLTSGPYCLR